MTLLTGFYLELEPARRDELIDCLRRNEANPQFDEIHLWIEIPANMAELLCSHPLLKSPKFRLVTHGQRVTFQDLFTYANRFLAGRGVVIANADIFFDDSLGHMEGCDLSGKLLCLSRWDVQPDGTARLFDHPLSQDAWVFQAPIREFACDFHLGLPGCDNRLAWEARNAKLKISNPAKSVRACHLHLSGVRRYTGNQRLLGQCAAVPAGFLAIPRSTINTSQPHNGRAGSSGCLHSNRISHNAIVKSEPILAVTSLSPAPWRASQQRACIASWRNAGLRVCSLNHSSDIPALNSLYDVELVPMADTSMGVFGRHYIPVSAALKWATHCDGPVLLINSDIELRLAPWELKRIRRLGDGGLCYFVRHNHAGDPSQASREAYGIDAFLLDSRDAALVSDSFLSIGQPFWDYLLPHLFAAQGRRVCAVEFPVAFHRDHPRQWSSENWHRCALEFERVTGTAGKDCSYETCVARSIGVKAAFEQKKVPLSPQPTKIREWVERTFGNETPKTFLELGSHCGCDTAWMAALPNVVIHTFEPDPRNHQPSRPNVVQHRAAIADGDGCAPFLLSREGWGQEWTHSSSIKKPKNHLHHYPVSFGETVEVETITLDSVRRREGLGDIDFIWADIQGAEGEMIRGGLETLAQTHYLYTEYSDDELYEEQATLRDIMELLPEFRVIELWPDDVLLENRRFSK